MKGRAPYDPYGPLVRKSIVRRMEAVGLPYELESTYNFQSVLPDGDSRTLPVVAYTDQGVFVGYHHKSTAHAHAARVRRMRNVNRVVVINDVTVL